jgi:hypothetical protein
MFQSSFTGLKPLQRNTSYMGGFCRFYYIPVERVVTFPRVNAANQQLLDEPTLVAGTAWFGPITVPKDALGFTEGMERTKAGPYYKYKLEGTHIGDSVESRVNIENMVHHRYLVVGKVRAGGFYMLIGTVDSPCSFDPDFETGTGPGATSKSKIVFSTDHISKAYILPSFNADALAAGDGSNGNGGNGNMANQREIIAFGANVGAVNIPWTPTRNGKFGSMPLVEVWFDDGVKPYISPNFGGAIECDHQPPAMTELNVKLGLANLPGFIVLG